MCMNYQVAVNPVTHKAGHRTRTGGRASPYITTSMILAGGFRKCSSPWRKLGPMKRPTWMSLLVTSRVSYRVAWGPFGGCPGSLRGQNQPRGDHRVSQVRVLQGGIWTQPGSISWPIRRNCMPNRNYTAGRALEYKVIKDLRSKGLRDSGRLGAMEWQTLWPITPRASQMGW